MANFIKGLLNSSLQVRLILLCNFLSAGFFGCRRRSKRRPGGLAGLFPYVDCLLAVDSPVDVFLSRLFSFEKTAHATAICRLGAVGAGSGRPLPDPVFLYLQRR